MRASRYSRCSSATRPSPTSPADTRGPGTIGIWDNRCTQHCAVNDYEGERVITRVTILGDHPEPAFEGKGWAPHRYQRTTAAASGLDRNRARYRSLHA